MSIDPVRFQKDDSIKFQVKKANPKKINRKTRKPIHKKPPTPHLVQDPIDEPSFSTSSSTTDHDFEDSSEGGLLLTQSATENDIFHASPNTRSNLPTQRFLDRYKSRAFTPTINTRLSLVPFQLTPQHFIITRHKVWHSGIQRKVFEFISTKSHEPLARADYASAFSSTLQVLNSKGVICEIDTEKSSGPYRMRMGNDIYLIIQGGNQKSGRSVDVQFLSVDGSKPPYTHLRSPEGICNDLIQAFGDRQAMKSVKNAKFMNQGQEIIAIRKVSKNRLEIDAKYNILYLHCFCIGLFMFITK